MSKIRILKNTDVERLEREANQLWADGYTLKHTHAVANNGYVIIVMIFVLEVTHG